MNLSLRYHIESKVEPKQRFVTMVRTSKYASRYQGSLGTETRELDSSRSTASSSKWISQTASGTTDAATRRGIDPEASGRDPEEIRTELSSATESLPTEASNLNGEAWYSGMLSFFGQSSLTDADKKDLQDAKAETFKTLSQCGPRTDTVLDSSHEREGVDNESLESESVSTLGKGLGDDLKSLPSVQGDVLPGEDGSIGSIDNFDFPKDSNQKRMGFSKRRESSNENVEYVIDQKIHNIRSEASHDSGPESVASSLRNKMFPKTSGRPGIGSSSSSSSPQESIVEARRKLLVKELRRSVESYGRYDKRCANITAALGDLYEENKDFQQATRLHKDAVSVYSVKLGDDHETTLKAKTRLGKVQENASDFSGAIATLFEVMSMTKALNGEKSSEAADAMVNISHTLKRKGNFELAIKTLKRALKIYRDLFGDSHPSVSSTVDSIASLYITIGDFSKASAILEEVVKLKAATVGPSSTDVASSLAQLATCYECAEQYSKAMKNLKKSYKIYADAEGESSEKAILVLERIALIYQATGQFKKAAIAYLGVLRGRKRELGESHPTVADTYFHLGVSLRESGQQEKAFKCMKQSLNIYVGEGRDMHDVEMIAEVMHELAIIHKSNNNIADAIKTFKQEVAVRRKLGQPEYPLIAQTLNHLGVAEFEIKNHNRALNYFMEALTIYEKKGTDMGTDFAEVLYNTGLVFETMRNKQRAFDAFLESARLFKENGYGENHPHLNKAMGKLKRLGHVCKCRGKRCSNIPCDTIMALKHQK